MSPTKTQSFFSAALATLLAALATLLATLLATGSVGGQAPPPGIVGSWRADAPLSNGVVQTFRFDPEGKFELVMALAVDGSYRVERNLLIETVALQSIGATHTDTATFSISGDSLMVSDRAGAPPRFLHRSGTPAGTPVTSPSIVGDWTILVGTGVAAHYIFAADGTMHVRAQVGDEQGKYTVKADTLHLSNDKTFQLPAIAQFAITDSVLSLTPQNGKAARHFHKIVPR